MKKMTLFSTAFAVFFSHISCLEADNWAKTTPLTLAQTATIILTESSINSLENPKEVERLMVRIDSKINALMKEKAKNQAKLEASNTRLSDKQKDKIAAALKNLDSRLAELNTSKVDIDRLSNDAQHIYVFSNMGENGVTKSTDKEIVIHGANDALLIHEIRHISLWLQTGRSLKFNKDNLLMAIIPNGSYDELRAYRAQYAFLPNSLPRPLPTNIEDVSIAFVAKIRREDGTLAYPLIYQIWANNLKITITPNNVNESTQRVYMAAIAQ